MRGGVFVDVGSSTVKVYVHSGDLTVVAQKSIPFKNGFSSEHGITRENTTALFDLVSDVQKQYPSLPVHMYATAIFRKANPQAQQAFQEQCRLNGFTCTIVSQEMENNYLVLALIGRCTIDEPLLLINIGGGSTELAVLRNRNVIEQHNLEFGVGTLMTTFQRINHTPGVPVRKVVEYVKEQLPQLETNASIAFYTGGELTYMRLTDYPLVSNALFEDKDHPYLIRTPDFTAKNRWLFKQTLPKLRSLMPNNPKWMDGARACSALAQAICEKYGITTIIPSDSNTIHGIVRSDE